MKGRQRATVAGNWKMHSLASEARKYGYKLRRADLPPAVRVLLFPSFPLLPVLAAELAGSRVELGGQDLHSERAGAHTGDVSGDQLSDAGCRWVLCGHSERRRDHGETDAVVAAKVRAAWSAGLRPMLCLGETLAERRDGATEAVLARQIAAALHDPGGPFAVAYEPVWAIGTGESATPEQAQAAHAFLRRQLAGLVGDDPVATTTLLYGGSVTPENCMALFAQPDVDGFLVGGASLDPERFLDIIRKLAESLPRAVRESAE